MESGATTSKMAKLPILNPKEYDLWLMRIEQYFFMTNYSLWEVIMNGNKVLKKKVGETEQDYDPTTAEEKQDRRNETKARGTLLMALPNKYQLKFHAYKDAKLLMEAIEKRYGGNKYINSNSSTNEADSTAYEISTATTQGNYINSLSVDNLSDAVICAFLVTEGIRGTKEEINGRENSIDDGKREVLPAQTLSLLESQVTDKCKTGLGYNAVTSTTAQPAVEKFVSSTEMLDNQENNKRYHVVPPPLIGNFIPSKPDIMFLDEVIESEHLDVITVVTPSNAQKDEIVHESVRCDAVEPRTVRKNNLTTPIIEEWNSDDESEVDVIPRVMNKTMRSSYDEIKFVK
ncbi:hypothetical protein Tco_1168112, partial [Tanacetum coccineum]